MQEVKTVVVVGGVAGGMSFATRFRRLNPDAKIVIFEKGPYVSFANCGLPYYVGGEITDHDELVVAEEDMLVRRFALDIHTNSEVTKIDPLTHQVTFVHDGQEATQGYDKLVLSPGARPFVPPMKGLELRQDVFTLRNIPDVDRIMDYLEAKKPSRALVIGAGFIGLEMAENLKHRGLDVTVVEKAPQILPPFDQEMAAIVEQELKDNGLHVYTGTSVVEFKTDGAILEDGTLLQPEMIILSVGVLPESGLAKDAGLMLGMKGGIVVDEHFQTSDPDIYAIGDAVIVKHTVNHQDVMIALASPANRQGRQLADHLTGQSHQGKGSLGTAIVRLFNLSAASTGLNERQLSGREVMVMHLLPNDHAGYFPNPTPIYLKVIFDPQTQEILGAQAVGQKGVDKRIDVLATAIKAGMKITDLQELELSYAPPFGSAKDAINMVGYVAENMIRGITKTVQWNELASEMSQGAVLLDVRSASERAEGYLKGSIHISLDRLRQKLEDLPKDQKIIVYCHSGVRSYNAERILRGAGFNVRNLDGSYSFLSLALPQEVTKDAR